MQQTIPGNYRVGTDAILLWTIACALTPVLMGITSIAFYKEILSADPHATLIRNVRWAAFLGAPLLCVGLQWYALRRFAPRLALWMWVGAAVVTVVAPMFLPSWIRLDEREFRLALLHWGWSEAASISLVGRVALAFGKVFGQAVAVALATSLLHTVVIRFATQLPWKMFLMAAIAGAGAAVVITYLPDFLGIYRYESLNGLSWRHRLVEFALRACAGASHGIASSFVVYRMLVPSEVRKIGPILSLATVAVIAIPVSIAVSGRDGGRSAAFSVLKAFTAAPAKDVSHGEAILQFSHLVETRPGSYPVANWSPDSRYMILRDRHRRPMLVEVATGRELGQLAEASAFGESSALAWSPDSRAVVLRTHGAADPIPGRKHLRNRTRLRKFSIPARELLAEYHTAPDECYVSFAGLSLIHAPDGNSLWAHCSSRMALQPESIMAIQVDAGSLRPLRRKLYGAESIAGEVRTLGISSGEVVYLQRRQQGEVEEIRLGHLGEDTVVLRIDNLNATGLTSGLTAQGETIDDRGIFADYCGQPVLNGVADGKSICRGVDIDATTGEILQVSDDVDRRFEPHRQVVSSGDGLKVEGRQQPTSKRAEILVVDAGTGNVRQRIETREQRPLSFSPDGRWLVTHLRGTKRLAVYRVTR